MQYLHDEQYYVDFYDLLTVRECLRIIEFGREVYRESQNKEEFKKTSEEEKQKAFNYLINSKLFIEKGERYRRKKQRIEEMIEEDRIASHPPGVEGSITYKYQRTECY